MTFYAYDWTIFLTKNQKSFQNLPEYLKEKTNNSLLDYQTFLLWKNYSRFNYSLINYHFCNDLIGTSHLNSISDSLLFIPEQSKRNNFQVPLFNEDRLSNYRLYKEFAFLHHSSFIAFFINNLIDTPNCFQKLKSIKRRAFELPLLKFINFLTRQGKREKYQSLFFKSLNFLYANQSHGISENNFTTSTISPLKQFNYNWVSLYLTLRNLFSYNEETMSMSLIYTNEFKYELNHKNIFYNKGKLTSRDSSLKQLFISKFLTNLPIFMFFIHNVDKNVKKYSRGKSGKYSFVWKYIAPYKRFFVTLKLIAKEIKFMNGRTLPIRIQNALTLLFSDFQKSFIWKAKLFSYNYIFKNYRNTLMKTLKSVK